MNPKPQEPAPKPKWDPSGLIVTIAQDYLSGEIRMVAYANQEALDLTLSTGQAHFYSRSRQSLWKKGDTSGNTLSVKEVWLDCDGDALVYLVDPTGPSCHTGSTTCFFTRLDDKPAQSALALPSLAKLWNTLVERQSSTGTKSYTRSLLDGGPTKLREKIEEEASELSDAIESESDDRVVSEAADVLYHLLVGLLYRNVTPRDVFRKLNERHGTSGHDERKSRAE